MGNDDLTNLRKVRPEWADVMAQTLLIDLSVCRWRASVKTDWEQLGLPAAIFSKAFTPGARKLLPDNVQKELDQLEQLARETLKRFGLKTLFGVLMPKAKYFEFSRWIKEAKLVELRDFLYGSKVPEYADLTIWSETSLYDRWFQLRDEIAANRDVIVNQVANMYDGALENIWRRQHDITPRTRPLDTAEELAFSEWLDEKKQAIVASIPSADYIKNSFVLEWSLSEVETPPEVVKAAKLDVLERRERELERAIQRADTERSRLELDRQRQQVVLDKRIAEEIARTRDTAGARFQKAIDEIIEQLQGALYEMILEQLAYLKEKGSLHPRNVGRINTMVAFVQDKLVGLTNDEGLKRACDGLEALAKSGNATKENAGAQVERTLRQIALDMKLDLLDANVPSRSGREFGIPDEADQILLERRQQRTLFEETPAEADDKPLERQARRLEAVEP